MVQLVSRGHVCLLQVLGALQVVRSALSVVEEVVFLRFRTPIANVVSQLRGLVHNVVVLLNLSAPFAQQQVILEVRLAHA